MAITIVLDTPEYCAIAAAVSGYIAYRSRRGIVKASAWPRRQIAKVARLKRILTVGNNILGKQNDHDPTESCSETAVITTQNESGVSSKPATAHDLLGPTAYGRQSACHFLTKLPLEIRAEIYQYLLVTAEVITTKRQLLGDRRYENQPPLGLDIQILSVCKAIYSEALPILYGGNILSFDGHWKIHEFLQLGLDQSQSGGSIFGLQRVPRDVGRFALIRHIAFDMSKASCGSGGLARSWKLLVEKKYSRFPILRSVYIDFSGRGLSNLGDRRLLKDFLVTLKTLIGRKLPDGSRSRLRKITFVGEYDQATLAQLGGLVEKGGEIFIS